MSGGVIYARKPRATDDRQTIRFDGSSFSGLGLSISLARINTHHTAFGFSNSARLCKKSPRQEIRIPRRGEGDGGGLDRLISDMHDMSRMGLESRECKVRVCIRLFCFLITAQWDS